MRGNNSNKNGNMHHERRTPTFTVHDEIKRNRRIERNKRIRQAREVRRRILTVFLSCMVVLIALVAVLFTVMRVQTVTVTGNLRYNSDSILDAAALDGDILPLLSEETVYKKIVTACPYVNSIKLKKTYPSTVEIVVTEANVVYCADIHGRRYSLDTDLRVIEFTENNDGLVFLKLPEIVTAIEGNKIVFADERYVALIPEILSTMFKTENTLPFTMLDLTNRFSITGIVDNTVKIDFGDYNDLSLKLKAAKMLVEKAEEQHSSRTLINVSALSGSGPSMVLDFDGEF